MKKMMLVVTGGPSGGKTTLIQALQKDMSPKVTVVPEAASILYHGGFPRKGSESARKHTQKAICWVQGELEEIIKSESDKADVIICDRGRLDSVAYWPGNPDDLFHQLSTTREREIARYDWVIHLDTAHQEFYDTTNPVRTETLREAKDLNDRIKAAWATHPQRIIIPHHDDFLTKMAKARSVVSHIIKGQSYVQILADLEAVQVTN